MTRTIFVATLATLAVCGASTAALAQTSPTPDLRVFRPSLASSGGLMIAPTATSQAGEWTGGALFSWSYKPLVLQDGTGRTVGEVIDHQVGADWFMNVGLGKKVELGLIVPTVLWQRGQDNDYTQRSLDGAHLIAQGMGDATVVSRISLVSHGTLGGFGLAATGAVSLPTGDENALFADGALGSELRLTGEYAMAGAALRATTGFRLRTEQRTYADTTWGNEIPWAVGLSVKPQAFGIDSKGRWLWSAEAFGALPAGPRAPFEQVAVSPALFSLSARYALGDVSLVGALQGPLDGAAGVPAVRAIAGLTWAPRMEDEDHDGVDDAHDECPELAEDHDGFEDGDGCPDFDNDSDGVPDIEDQCPNEPEDLDDVQDDDGCPEPEGQPLP